MSNSNTIEFNGKKWIDIQDPSTDQMKALSNEYKLNEHLVKDSMQPDHLPKYDSADDVNFLLLRFQAIPKKETYLVGEAGCLHIECNPGELSKAV